MPEYANIRQILGHLIGKRIVDITQHDQEEWEQDGTSYVHLMLEDGDYLKFYIGEAGFDHSGDGEDEDEEEVDA